MQLKREKKKKTKKKAGGVRKRDSPGALFLRRESVGLARSIDYTKGIAEGLRSLGFCCVRRSENEEALTYLKEAFSLFESLNDCKGLSVVYEYLGLYNAIGEILELPWNFYIKGLH